MLDLLRLLPHRVSATPDTRPLIINAIATSVVIAANTAMQVRLNRWNGDFYGALEKRDFETFIHQLGVFLVIAAILLVLVVAQTYLQEMGKVRLRTALTHRLVDRWLTPRAPYRLRLAGEVGAHPDQRLQEDVRHFSELSVGLATGLLQSTLLLFTFVGVLWTLSQAIPITLFGTTFQIHGLLLWGTLFFAVTGSLLTYIVGAPLVKLHNTRYSREADFRFAVVRVAEGAQEIAFARGEGAEQKSVIGAFGQVRTVMVALAGAIARVTWITSGYGWLAIVAPVALASPAYFAGALTFGQVMMAVQAFYQVQQSLRWFVDNYPTIADWRATRVRVDEFNAAVEAADALGADEPRIVVAPHPEGHLAFRDVTIKLPDGTASFMQNTIEVGPGERVVIVGAAGAGKSMLFRAMAELWPWGGGTILMPPAANAMFLTERPYLPTGSLADALVYPHPRADFSDAQCEAALRRVGLDAYVAGMGVVKRWDRELSLQEQQSLSFARLLLHRPRWIFLDEATSACIDSRCEALVSIFNHELAESAVIGLARMPTNGLYARILRLQRHDDRKMQLDLPQARESGGPVAGAPPKPFAAARRAEPGETTPLRVEGSHAPSIDKAAD